MSQGSTGGSGGGPDLGALQIDGSNSMSAAINANNNALNNASNIELDAGAIQGYNLTPSTFFGREGMVWQGQDAGKAVQITLQPQDLDGTDDVFFALNYNSTGLASTFIGYDAINGHTSWGNIDLSGPGIPLRFTANFATNFNIELLTDFTTSFNNNRIVNLADPTGAQDGATKAYVDAVGAGLVAQGSGTDSFSVLST